MSEMDQLPEDLRSPLTELLLSLADDKLVLGHRNSDWTGLGPILEEDIAFSSLAQDEIGHAGALFQLLAPWLNQTADQIAYGRKPQEYRCAEIVELPDDFEWGFAIVRQFFCDNFDLMRLERLSRSSLAPLAALARRQLAEERIHAEHANAWIQRLGRGTDESRQRVQAALDTLSPFASMLFEATPGADQLESADIYPRRSSEMFDRWRAELETTARNSGLRLQLTPPSSGVLGGRRGRHSAAFDELWKEMTEVSGVEPQAAW
ncbi:MAG: phenylacetate-CoA oxygenase subunit PaaC [Phycisphaerales bacterium]|nr:phenylacetate-CoA oxygenase subunit PaaC [Phycisphaerales bacterium]